MQISVFKQRVLELQMAWVAAVVDLAANEDSEYARERVDVMEQTCKNLATICGFNAAVDLGDEEY
jgi:hypothetical protein